MTLLERVGLLLRANLNDLIDRAEDPEKTLKQVILDMRNQLLQVKTQVALSIADEHLLEKKRREQEAFAGEWKRKAELAVDRSKDDLARAALERCVSFQTMAKSFEQQVTDQKAQVENLKKVFRDLEQKLAEARSQSVLLMARHRRSRAARRAGDAHEAFRSEDHASSFDRMKDRILQDEAVAEAHGELAAGRVEDQLTALEREGEIEGLLAQIKLERGTAASR